MSTASERLKAAAEAHGGPGYKFVPLADALREIEAMETDLRQIGDLCDAEIAKRQELDCQIFVLQFAAQAVLNDEMTDCRKSLAERLQAALETPSIAATSLAADNARLTAELAAVEGEIETNYGDQCRWCGTELPVERTEQSWIHPDGVYIRLCAAYAARERRYQRQQAAKLAS